MGKYCFIIGKDVQKIDILTYTLIMIFLIILSIILILLVFLITRFYYLKEIKKLTIKDKKTGIYNRTYFDQVYVSEFHRARRIQHPISLIFIKSDKYIELGKNLMDSIKRDTDFIALYEEGLYVAVLYDTDSNGTDKVIYRIMETKPLDNDINIGVYAGVPDSHTSSSYMIETGIKALEKSIRNGKNCVEFSLDSV